MTASQTVRRGSLALVALLAGGNLLPNSCVNKKVVVAPEPVVVEEPVSSFGEQVERLNRVNPQYALTERDLVALTRMLYFEDKFDRKLPSDAEQKKGYAAVAEVIKNRFLFDTCGEHAPIKNPTCQSSERFVHYDGDQGLAAVIEQHAVISGQRIYQFTSQSDFSRYFTLASLAQGIDFTRNTEEKHQIDLAYNALVGVLDGSISPLTEGALSYKNSDTTNQVWNDKQVFLLPSDECDDLRIPIGPKGRASVRDGSARCRIEQSYVHDRTKVIGSHDFYTVVEGDRKEVVWDNPNRNTYVDGVCTKGPCR